MGYVIESEKVTNFIQDTKIKLPRFQRKGTWKDKQNFELAISIFQGYPVGVVIINKEKKVSWLLDGRQRRNALKEMRENPVKLYEWAKKYLKFRQNFNEHEITGLFHSKVSSYLQAEDKNNEEYEEDIEKEYEDIEESSFDRNDQAIGLKILLEIILMVHEVKNGTSKWEALFDFTEYFNKLKYVKIIEGEKRIDPVSLRSFLLEMSREYQRDNDDVITKDFFINYYLDQIEVSEEKITEFKNAVVNSWEYITNSIKIIDDSEQVFDEARIGVINLTNASPLDAQNIFSRINSGGTILKAEELLSAKPFWNIRYNIINEDYKEEVRNLYKKLGVYWDGTLVRWDAAAILISNIDKKGVFFDIYKEDNKLDIESVTLGFKLISAYFTKGISANHVTQLETSKDIDWDISIKNFENDIKQVTDVLLNDKHFKILKNWNYPLNKMLGNAPTLEFITICYLNWIDKNRPIANSGEGKAFKRDAKILLDKLIYEYSIRRWSGSSDSKVRFDIGNWKDRLKIVPHDDWNDLITEVSEGENKGNNVKVKTLIPIIYYFEVLLERLPEDKNEIHQIDHIFPQEKFKENRNINEAYKDSLSNLIILTKQENNLKGNKPLNEITDPSLKKSISRVSGINESDFDKYSDISNFNKLIEQRLEFFKSVINKNRKTFLSN
ncbi:DUF262 domain-containing protein [Staphylococcus casei]|uniref:DUF262 domain-containing protein n=1 Tax=Staphylococcus casei TaxID=201828 RepID=A0ABZ2WAL3_9STAP